MAAEPGLARLREPLAERHRRRSRSACSAGTISGTPSSRRAATPMPSESSSRRSRCGRIAPARGTISARRWRCSSAIGRLKGPTRRRSSCREASFATRSRISAASTRCRGATATRIPLLRRANAMKPGVPEVVASLRLSLKNQGGALAAAGRSADAEALFREGLDLGDEEHLYINLGRARIDQGRFGEAVPPLERAVQMNPRNPSGRAWLLRAYALAGARERAAGEMAALAALDPAMAAQVASEIPACAPLRTLACAVTPALIRSARSGSSGSPARGAHREGGANPPRPRHCVRGRNPRRATGRRRRGREGVGSRTIREPGDRPDLR